MSTGTARSRRAVAIDLLIATAFLLVGAWIATWSVPALIVLAIVAAVVGAVWYVLKH